jgi:cobalt-zinc-cadmium efflux system outer membrane protein
LLKRRVSYRSTVFAHLVGVAILGSVAACASSGKAPGRADVGEAIRLRTGAALRPESGPSLPPDVSLADGLSEQDAVAIALWNSPEFEASLSELGLARADLVEAGLLRNPVLSILFPVGPKQLEWTLQFAVEALWERPRRVAAFSLNAHAVGERLVSRGLFFIADVQQAYVDAAAAELRADLARENVEVLRRIEGITEARLRAGDISELEARAARSDRARAEASRLLLEHDRDVAMVTLVSRMGFESTPPGLRLAPRDGPTSPVPCSTSDEALAIALASRPDVRAAELAIEAAGARASWERSRVLVLIAELDANGQGREGYEMGPGIVADLPIFSRNQGGISRAEAELQRAASAYLALRVQVAAEVTTARIRYEQATDAAAIWKEEIVPTLQIEERQAERAYQVGEVALLALLDVSRRLVEARGQSLEAEIGIQKSKIVLNRSVGYTCASS